MIGVMAKVSDILIPPCKRPILVLFTHVPLFFFWIAFAMRDVADGSIKLKRGALVTLASSPAQFYVVATLIVAVAVIVAVRIVQAILMIADTRAS